MLKDFELVSGLLVNLAKSSILGVNLEDSFLQTSSDFLYCRCDKFPSTFLGILLGGNHKQLFMWSSVVEKMRSILSSWKCRFLSIGGRIN